MDRNQRVTIEDVAERAGVHAATVSRALTRPEKVAAATRERILAVIEEMDFVPNRAARGLITGQTDQVAVIVPDITNPNFAAQLQAAGRVAADAGLQLLLVDTAEHPEEEVRAARLLTREVDAFVVISPRRLHRELAVLGGTPAVFVNRPVKGRPSVVMRTAAAAEEAVTHLAGLGHTRLAYLGGPRGSWAAGERRRAVAHASAAPGIDVHEITSGPPTFETGAEAVGAVVASGATAVFAFNGQMALGVLAGLARQGIDVPGEISVVGGDDVPMAALTAPPLTALSLPTEAAGAAAVRMIREGTDARAALQGGTPGHVELRAHFEVRGSTAPVTGRRRRS